MCDRNTGSKTAHDGVLCLRNRINAPLSQEQTDSCLQALDCKSKRTDACKHGIDRYAPEIASTKDAPKSVPPELPALCTVRLGPASEVVPACCACSGTCGTSSSAACSSSSAAQLTAFERSRHTHAQVNACIDAVCSNSQAWLVQRTQENEIKCESQIPEVDMR
jgi:hypothetical protein